MRRQEENKELELTGQNPETPPLRVPGIEATISELRHRYPALSDEAIARILGLPSAQVSSTSTEVGSDNPVVAGHSENNG